MKLVMAVSKDGWLARKEDDDMSWLGMADKAAFRILTSVDGGHVGVSLRTAGCMPSVLPGRSLYKLSTVSRAQAWGTLSEFHGAYPGGCLVGGPRLAMEALRLAYISEVHLCRSERYAFPDSAARDQAIPDRITLQLLAGGFQVKMETKFGDTKVECWRK